VLESYRYVYDKNSNILMEEIYNVSLPSVNDAVHEERRFVYDPLGRLKSVTVENRKTGDLKTTVYTYDKTGNRLTETTGNEFCNNTYNSLNQQLTSIRKTGGNTASSKTYAYNGNGNLKKETDSHTGITVDNLYDEADRLVKATVTQSGTVSLVQDNVYNGNGQRIQKSDNGKRTDYYYHGSTVLYTTDQEGGKTSFNLLGPSNSILASGRYDGAYANNYYLHTKDVRGSTGSILSPDGIGLIAYRRRLMG